MISRGSQIPRACDTCGDTHTPSLCYVPLKCWNCGEKHSTTQEFCSICNSLTLPTLPREKPKSRISWKTILIAKTDSSQVKSNQLSSVKNAIDNDLYTAVLCAESIDTPYNKYKKKKTAVFLHRPGGEKRLSFTRSAPGIISAISREWVDIKLSDWAVFEEIVGVTSLPSTFPTPDDICALPRDEKDTYAAGFGGAGLRTG
ncbi:hypothetical protein BTUL_0029g00340 [Botrytis tulipae]|uniref:Uncharacterized protein n=1 Tax=Botrytis tulipae TaxID=87230 RepID=A0A4Z1EVA2_9HELO|nr:hypothetical protein BTUL_0029g00340 [Botrytis tulipae]